CSWMGLAACLAKQGALNYISLYRLTPCAPVDCRCPMRSATRRLRRATWLFFWAFPWMTGSTLAPRSRRPRRWSPSMRASCNSRLTCAKRCSGRVHWLTVCREPHLVILGAPGRFLLEFAKRARRNERPLPHFSALPAPSSLTDRVAGALPL